MKKYYFSANKPRFSAQDKDVAESLKKHYLKPVLLRYGLVGDLTQADSAGGTEVTTMGMIMAGKA